MKTEEQIFQHFLDSTGFKNIKNLSILQFVLKIDSNNIEHNVPEIIIKYFSLKPDIFIIVKTAIKYIIIVDNDDKNINNITGMNTKIKALINEVLLSQL